MSFVPFGERAMEMSVSLYTQIANKRAVIQARILHSIVKVSVTGVNLLGTELAPVRTIAKIWKGRRL